MQQVIDTLSFDTSGEGFIDITGDIAAWLHEIGADEGLLTLLLQHTSASLTIQENADPTVLHDLLAALGRLAPRAHPYRHHTEGPDDMPAHIRGMLTGVNLNIPVQGGKMMLGTWQALYVIEHRARPHQRALALHYIGY